MNRDESIIRGNGSVTIRSSASDIEATYRLNDEGVATVVSNRKLGSASPHTRVRWRAAAEAELHMMLETAPAPYQRAS